MSEDLVRFLCDRLDEDEEAIRAALDAPPHHSGRPHEAGVAHGAREFGVPDAVTAAYLSFGHAPRVLADVRAKRGIVEQIGWGSPDRLDCWLEAVQWLASAYAWHQDYRPEWAPDESPAPDTPPGAY